MKRLVRILSIDVRAAFLRWYRSETGVENAAIVFGLAGFLIVLAVQP